MTLLRSVSLFGIALLLSLSLIGCDSGDDSSSVDNRFSLEITETSSAGVVTSKQSFNTTIDGFSFFYDETDPETGQRVFAIYFSDQQELSENATSEGLFGLALRASSRPGTGSYQFANIDSPNSFERDFGLILFENIGNLGMQGAPLTYYVGTGGTLSLSTSSDERVAGTLSATGLRLVLDDNTFEADTTTVQITGTFDAQDANTFFGSGIAGSFAGGM